MRYRTRADANQKEIDLALRAIGASVVALGDVGKGCPDRLVGYRGINYLLETKNRAKFTSVSIAQRENLLRSPDQVKFHESWKGAPVAVVFTIDEALKAIGATG